MAVKEKTVATYGNITTNAAQEKALTWAVRKANAARAAEDPPKGPVTNQQYIDGGIVDPTLNSYLAQYEQRVADEVKAKYLAGNNTLKNQVLTLLGIDPDALI